MTPAEFFRLLALSLVCGRILRAAAVFWTAARRSDEEDRWAYNLIRATVAGFWFGLGLWAGSL